MSHSSVNLYFLKSCPFCGGEADPKRILNSYWIECKKCKTQTGIFSTMADAVTFWNRRITDVRD